MANWILAVLAIAAAVSAKDLAALQSPNKERGFFIQLELYTPELYGPLPFALDPVHFPRSLIAPHVDIDSLLLATAEECAREDLSRRERIYRQRVALVEFMASSVVRELGLTAVGAEVLWIQPWVFIPSSTPLERVNGAYLNALVSHRHVSSIIKNDIVAEIMPVEVHSSDDLLQSMTGGGNFTAWGIEKIEAEQAWSKTRGKDVIVGVIDTGVHFHHHSIRESYNGFLGFDAVTGERMYNHNYSWFDPLEFRNDDWWCDSFNPCLLRECCLDEPFDIIGHGTHCTSTIAGRFYSNETHGFTLGVAPDAKWIGAKGCRDGGCFRYGLITSAQWMACPTPINGTEADCSRGAHVINNSWSSKRKDDAFYDEVLQVWSDMGIIPVFAGGNSGPSCASATAPGNSDQVISAAASDSDDTLVRFSARGPGPYEDGGHFAKMKPDITAPGYKVLGADKNCNSSVMTMSGTSMASPHVTGVIALLLSQFKHADVSSGSSDDQMVLQSGKVDPFKYVLDKMCKSATHDLGDPIGGGGRSIPVPPFPVRKQCDKSSPKEFPNVFYGCGRVDARAAMAV